MGTQQVEALTSYLTRMAAVHLVRPRWLLWFVSGWSSTKNPSALNGMCAGTAAVVAALERCTAVTGLDRLTLLPWNGVLSSSNSLAKWQHWCPHCLAEWRALGLATYYPLAWCLTTVRWCTRHNRPLATRCPNPACDSSVDLLSPPGRCGRCWAWLGDATTETGSADLDRDADIWFARATARLIWRGQKAQGVTRAHHIAKAISDLCERVGVGNLDPFRKRLGLPGDMLYRWRSGRSAPSLDMFLTFCARLGVEPDDVLDGSRPEHLDLTPKGDEQARRALRAAPRAASRHVNRTACRRALKRALKAELGLAPSLSQIARELGLSYQLLRYHFPDLARTIHLRHRAGQQARRTS